MKKHRNIFGHLMVALLSLVICVTMLAPNALVNASATTVVNPNNAEATASAYGPVSVGGDALIKAIKATGDFPDEEVNGGWCVLMDVTDSVSEYARHDGERFVMELQQQFPSIDVYAFSYHLLVKEPWEQGMEKSHHATDIAAAYKEAANHYDHIVIVTDCQQEVNHKLEFGILQGKDIWIYQMDYNYGASDALVDAMLEYGKSDVSLKLYRENGENVVYRDDFPYEERMTPALTVDPTVYPTVDPTVDPTQQIPSGRTIQDFFWIGVANGNWSMLVLMGFVLLVGLIASGTIVACAAIKRQGNVGTTNINVDGGKISYTGCNGGKSPKEIVVAKNCEACPHRKRCPMANEERVEVSSDAGPSNEDNLK